MKRFSNHWTRIFLIPAFFICLAFASAQELVIVEDQTIQVYDSMWQIYPEAIRFIVWMPEEKPPEFLPFSIPSDITVLSALAPVHNAIIVLPEPVGPPAPAARQSQAAITAPPMPAASPTQPAQPVQQTVQQTQLPQQTPPARTTEAAETAGTGKTDDGDQPTSDGNKEPASQIAAMDSANMTAARIMESPVPDMNMEAVKGERFQLKLPGSGWTFLGDEDGKTGIRLESRQFTDGDASFNLIAEKPGEYLLRFSRQDPVRLENTYKLVQLDVKEAGAKTTSSVASSDTGQTAGQLSSGVQVETGTQPEPALEKTAEIVTAETQAMEDTQEFQRELVLLDTPEAILKSAREALAEKKIIEALSALELYLSRYTYGNDEVFYLYALAWEQDSPFRNIRKAHENYKRVRDDYPRSKYWRESAERVEYLERHYTGLR